MNLGDAISEATIIYFITQGHFRRVSGKCNKINFDIKIVIVYIRGPSECSWKNYTWI